MKKYIAAALCLVLLLTAVGCGTTPAETVVEGSMKTYSEMPDGTFLCEGNTYQYKLTVSGRIPNAEKDTTFTYLSNIEKISFEQAWKASGFSSLSTDYFNPKDAVLVDIKTE